jgi:prepilin peptidase CpaA
MNSWYVLFSLACVVTLVAALIDFRTGIIPNKLTLALFALGLPAHILVLSVFVPKASIWFWVGDAVLGVVICGLVPYVLWKAGGLLGGDLKLFAALGALLGVRAGLEVQLVAFTGAALILPAVMAYQGKLWGVLKNTGRLMINPFIPAHKRHPLPPEVLTQVRFGPAIFAATALVACTRFWG